MSALDEKWYGKPEIKAGAPGKSRNLQTLHCFIRSCTNCDSADSFELRKFIPFLLYNTHLSPAGVIVEIERPVSGANCNGDTLSRGSEPDPPENDGRNVQATATPCGSHDLDACDVAGRELFTRPPDSNANHSW